MIGPEPRIAIAASPREWALGLHRHVADHGGATVRATVLHADEAIGEEVDVVVLDDTTSFLSPRLVDELHRRGRAVLGVFDPDDPCGKGELLDCGADEVIERGAGPAAFVEAIAALAALVHAPREGAGPGPPPAAGLRAGTLWPTAAPPEGAPALQPGLVTVVAGVSGGAGATEVAIGLAAESGRRGDATVLVDADDVAPAAAQRLGLGIYPNIRAALDALARRSGPMADVLVPVAAGGFAALPGLASPRAWADLRPLEVGDLLRALAHAHRHVVCNAAHRIEDLAGAPGSAPRYGLARHLLATADVIVAVAGPSPVGVARLLDWLADVRDLPARAPTHVVVNRAPADRFRRSEIAGEIERGAGPAGVWFVPDDDRVGDAAWRGTLPGAGPFVRALGALARALLPEDVPGGRAAGRRRGHR